MSDRDPKNAKKTFTDYLNISSYKTNPFGQNVSGEQAFARTERIGTALYLLTNTVPEQEPLRTRVRTHTHDLVTHVLALRSGMRAAGEEGVGRILGNVRELISLVWMLHVAGFVSRHNADIVIRALDDLGDFIGLSRTSVLAEQTTLHRTDLIPVAETHVHTDVGVGERRIKKSESKKPVIKQSVGSAQASTTTARNRREIILTTLQKGGALGIKDIAAQVVGCSEKTVQRELHVLVRDGLVEKRGEKRWSTYHIVG